MHFPQQGVLPPVLVRLRYTHVQEALMNNLAEAGKVGLAFTPVNSVIKQVATGAMQV
jgi:hypothetical protein